MTIERDRKQLQASLRDRAARKRALKLPPNPNPLADVHSPASLAQIRGLLVEVHAMLTRMSENKGPVDFVVTGRDSNGDVKTFRAVEN